MPKSEPLRWLLAIFATYRLALLVAREEGPAAILLNARALLGAYDYGEDGQPLTNLGRGITCPFCVGVWIAAGITLLLLRPSKLGNLFLAWMGIAGAQVFFEQLSD